MSGIMSLSGKVIDSFNKCVDDLIPELKEISARDDLDDDIKASKLKRKIEAWFRHYGRLKK